MKAIIALNFMELRSAGLMGLKLADLYRSICPLVPSSLINKSFKDVREEHMRIEELERRYQILAGDLRTGKISEVTFTLALDNLHFQDEWGRYWMIGSQTGAWYCYDGQNWH